jgi:hypothetical protein
MTAGWRGAPRACKRRSRPAALALAGPLQRRRLPRKSQLGQRIPCHRATVPTTTVFHEICRSAVVWQSLVRFRSGLDFMLIYRCGGALNCDAVCLATGSQHEPRR